MHKVIAVIVNAKDEAKALEIARTTFESLVGDDKRFDYFQMVDNPGTPMSGSGRASNLKHRGNQ